MLPIAAVTNAAATDAELKPPVIAVVDIQHLFRAADAARDIQSAIDAQREIYARDVADQERRLRELEQTLIGERGASTPEEFAARRRAFEQQIAAIQRDVQARKRRLDQAFNESMATVRESVLKTVADVAQELGATVVLNRNQVVIVEKSLEITDLVLERLNERLPSVEVTIPD